MADSLGDYIHSRLLYHLIEFYFSPMRRFRFTTATFLWFAVLLVCSHYSTYGQTIASYYSEEGLVIAAITTDDTGFSGNTTVSYLGRDTVCNHPVYTYAAHQSACARSQLYIEDQRVYVIYDDCSKQLYFDFGASVGDTIRSIINTMIVEERSSITLYNGEVRPAILVRSINSQGPDASMTIVPGIGAIEHGFYFIQPNFFFFGSLLEGVYHDNDTLVAIRSGNDLGEITCLQSCSEWKPTSDSLTLSPEHLTTFGEAVYWEWGDGNSSNLSRTSHTYDSIGCYTVSRTVMTDCDTSTSYRQICLCTPQYWRLDSTYRRPVSSLPYQYWLRNEITNLGGQYLLWDRGQLVDSISIAGTYDGQPYHIHSIQHVSPDTLVFVAGDSAYHQSTKLMAGYIHKGQVVITAQIADKPIYSVLRSTPDKTVYVDYSQGDGQINYSADRGESWTTATVPIPDSLAFEQANHILLYQKNDHLVVFSVYWEWLDPTNNLLRTISESTDAGLTWTQRALQNKENYYYDSYDQTWRIDQNELYVKGDDQVTWQRRGSDIEVASIKMYGKDSGFCQDKYGSIFHTEDGFRTPAVAIGNRYGHLNDIIIGSDGRPYLLQNEYPNPRRVFTLDLQAEANCFTDDDGDGLRSNEDCDDTDSDIYHGNIETPYDGKDNDCNSDTPDDDLDNDGYGIAEDCDDTNASIYPGAPEIANNERDDNCNGLIDEINTRTTDLVASNVKVYPNPVDHILYVSGADGISQLRIYDLRGRVVRSLHDSDRINVSDVESGIYIMQVVTATTTISHKIIIW